MILAINIGNTNIRAAIPGRETVFNAKEGPVIGMIEAGLGLEWQKLEGSILASVVPSQTDMVVAAIEGVTRKPVKRIDVRSCGKLRTDSYIGLLGEDRVVCCAWALEKYAGQCLVVIDFGTASTINVVSADGNFLGGAILPGLHTGLDALTRNTAQLPKIELSGAIPLIGKNTVENLQSGAVIGLACATEGFLGRIEEDLGCKPIVVVTGGHAPKILPHCRFEHIHEPGLLLEGLLELYRGYS